MQVLKQSTANQYIYVYLVDATDGYTPETGVTSPTIYISKNGGSAAAPSDGTWAEISAANMPGWYTVRLNATDTNTVGLLAIDVYKSGTSRHFATVAYVSAYLTDDVKTDTAAILDDTGTSGVLLAGTATSAALVDAVWDEAISGHLSAGTTGKALSDANAAANPWSVDPSGYTDLDTFGGAIRRITAGAGSNSATVTVEDADDNPLEGVRVDIYSSATPSASTFITGGYTNSSGQFTFYGPTGTYYAFRYKRGYSFDDPVTVTIT